jgi:hypothetical protein
MKRVFSAAPLLSALACTAQGASNDAIRSVILIAAGAAAVILLILFGRPHAKHSENPSSEGRQKP